MYYDSLGNRYQKIVNSKANTPHSAKSSKGGMRKHGRNKTKCERYRREGRRETNKIRRAAKRIG